MAAMVLIARGFPVARGKFGTIESFRANLGTHGLPRLPRTRGRVASQLTDRDAGKDFSERDLRPLPDRMDAAPWFALTREPADQALVQIHRSFHSLDDF